MQPLYYFYDKTWITLETIPETLKNKLKYI